jgi:hypothetical protein
MAAERIRSDLRPLCFEHHIEMKSVQLEKSANGFTTYSLAYACPFSGCTICYTGKTGYFAAESDQPSKRAGVLRLSCPHDGLPMYLASMHPDNSAWRLWLCAKTGCQGRRTIEEHVFEPEDAFAKEYFRTN